MRCQGHLFLRGGRNKTDSEHDLGNLMSVRVECSPLSDRNRLFTESWAGRGVRFGKRQSNNTTCCSRYVTFDSRLSRVGMWIRFFDVSFYSLEQCVCKSGRIMPLLYGQYFVWTAEGNIEFRLSRRVSLLNLQSGEPPDSPLDAARRQFVNRRHSFLMKTVAR